MAGPPPIGCAKSIFRAQSRLQLYAGDRTYLILTQLYVYLSYHSSNARTQIQFILIALPSQFVLEHFKYSQVHPFSLSAHA